MMLSMRTTVRIDDDLISEIKARADQQGVSVARMLNRVLRTGLDALGADDVPVRPFRERPVSMGKPRINLDKALGERA